MSTGPADSSVYEWRVRSTVKVASVVVGFVVLPLLRDSLVSFAAYCVVVFLLVFRPMVRLREGVAVLRGPLRTVVVHRDEVEKVRTNAIGLVIERKQRRNLYSLVFQTGIGAGEPRWFDFAELFTGTRPHLPQESDT